LTYYQIALLLCLGSVTGLVAGLLGIGGGMIMVPFLTFLFESYQFPQEHILHMAIATSMTTILFTAISSVRAQQKKKMIRWDIVIALAPGIIFGGILGGGKIFSALQGPWLTIFFASFQYFSAYQMLANKKPQASRTLPGKAGLFGTGSLIGGVSSLVGAGGAFISVPFMLWCNIPIHSALATSSALGFPIAAASAIGYIIGGLHIENLPAHSLGYIYLPAVLCISVMSMLTASVGVRIAHQLNTTQLRKMFAIVLICIASYMLCKNVFQII
jgi:uncharacterized membrane protein YfcA